MSVIFSCELIFKENMRQLTLSELNHYSYNAIIIPKIIKYYPSLILRTYKSLKSKYHVGQFSSVTQSRRTLCDPMDCNTLGFPVHPRHLEPTQTHVFRVADAIQPSHSLSSPSPPAFSFSQDQRLFQ